MALYDFRNKKTGKVKEYDMKISEYDQFVIDHPELERTYDKVASIGDPVRLGIKRPPKDFQTGVLDRIKHSVPGAKPGMSRTRWGTNITEV